MKAERHDNSGVYDMPRRSQERFHRPGNTRVGSGKWVGVQRPLTGPFVY